MGRSGGLRQRRGQALRALVATAAAAAAVLVWYFTLVSVRAERQQAQAHAQARAASLALAVGWQLDRQVRTAADDLRRLAALWEAGASADLGPWPSVPPGPGAEPTEFYVLDAYGRVLAATQPELIGTSRPSDPALLAWRSAQARARAQLVTPDVRWEATGRWRIEVSRPYLDPGGRPAGLAVAAYDPWSLTNLLEQIDLGPRGLIALIGDDGAMRVLVSPGAVPPGTDVSGTAMFHAARAAPQGAWTGTSAPDGVARIHAFRRLAGQDLTVAIGIDRQTALREAAGWAATARLFALGITASILAVAVLSWKAIGTARRRAAQEALGRLQLEQAYRRADEARAQAEHRTAQLEGVLAGMSDGVMLLDGQLRLALWNARFALYTGVPAGLLQAGVPMEELLRAQAQQGEFGVLATPEAVEAEVRQRMDRLRSGRFGGPQERTRPGGRSIEFRRSLLPGDGCVTLYTDITARRLAGAAQEQARRIAAEAAEQQARFVAVVSHEIRTPLSAVLGSLALLDQSALSAAQQRHAETAREAGNVLLDLVNDVLDMARMEAGQVALRPAPVELRRLLDSVEAIFRVEAARRGMTLSIEMAPELPRLILADGRRLRQVLANLVGNAVKFAAAGPVAIRACATVAGGEPALLLAVSDPGPRIAPSEAAMLFRPFSRLAAAEHAGAPGSGLGLAICAALVRLMGGQVGVGEDAAGGNAFWCALPLHPADAPAAAAGTAPAPSLRRTARRSILLVEDVAANRAVTAALLRRARHRVEVADSGAEAVRLAAAHFYDLVLMDLSMPGMSGFEAAAAIRALPGPAARVPIVALTATAEAGDRARCAAAGIGAVLPKPASAEALERLAAAPPPHSEPAFAPAAAVLDRERFRELTEQLPPQTLAALAGRCLDDARAAVRTLHEAAVAGDAPALAAAAHALAGLAATFGLARLAQHSRRILELARAGPLEPVRAALPALAPELEAAARALAPEPAGA